MKVPWVFAFRCRNIGLNGTGDYSTVSRLVCIRSISTEPIESSDNCKLEQYGSTRLVNPSFWRVEGG
jgi:hypothetical protein